MQDSIDLSKINDLKELKALKADEYDKVELAKEQIDRSNRNIFAINARIAEVQQAAEAKTKSVSQEEDK